MQITHLILKNLIHNEGYCRSVIPFLKSEYFSDRGGFSQEKLIFDSINTYVSQYNQIPSIEAIKILISGSKKTEYEKIDEIEILLDSWKESESHNLDWLTTQTEDFCKEKALHNAILESIKIISDEKETREKSIIPELLKEALSITFDPTVGHDLIENAESRYEFYHRAEERIPFNIMNLNLITGGGIPKKTLNIIVAGVNVGKSLAMCDMAANNLLLNKNVLYITCEMAEERIAERIDANLLDITLDTLKMITKQQYMRLINRLKNKTTGKLVIKEYPTSGANASHFRYLLHELQIKKNFVPDIIYIDYLNICSSSRIKNTGNVNSYTLIKSISEELRGLAVEQNLPIVTATQFTRAGSSNSDANMTDVAESFGTVASADLVLALINTDELEQLGQLMIKQLKNRYNDVTKNKKFLVGIDRSKMRLFDIGDVQVDNEGGLADNYMNRNDSSHDFSDHSQEEPPASRASKFDKFKF